MVEGLCARHLPHLHAIAVKVSTRFAAGERALPNAGFIQSVVRSRQRYMRVHRLLCVLINSGALPNSDVDVIPDGNRDDDRRDAAGDTVGVDDGADGARMGSDGSLSVVGDVAGMLAVELSNDVGVVLKWGGDTGALAGAEDPTS